MYIRKAIVIIILMCGSMTIMAQPNEQVKRIEKNVLLPSNAEISISNKYGNVHVLHWEKDSVRFEVELIFRSSKVEKMDKMMREIDVRFNESMYYVSAVTTFPGSGKLWNEITDVTKNVLQSGNEAEINYTVYVPARARLKIENRFGNIYMHDHPSACTIRLSNGTFQANEINGKSQIIISFGNAQIEKLKDAQVELNYADLQLAHAGRLQLNGRSSTIQIGQLDELQLDSRRDKLIIQKAGSVKGEASFSRLQLEHLSKDLLLTTNYGNLHVLGVDKQAGFLQLSSSFTSLKIILPKGVNASMNINWEKKSRILLPDQVRFKHAAMENLNGEEGAVEATIGKEKGMTMRFNLSGGDLEISEINP